MALIEFSSNPGKTFTVSIRDPLHGYSLLATGIACTEIRPSRYRANVGNLTGKRYVEAVAGATLATGFVDLDNPEADTGASEVRDTPANPTEVTFLPLSAQGPIRQEANLIQLFVGEAATVAVSVTDSEGQPVSLTGRTLSLEIETQSRAKLQKTPIVATGSAFSFVPNSAVTSTARDLYWALWDTVADSVLCFGKIEVDYVPVQ